MSQFTTPAVLELLDDYKWRVAVPFVYYTDCLNVRTNIIVPAGTVTDLASVPRILWTVFPPHGKYAKAAIVHDFLYTNALYNKRIADDVFNEAMCVLKVPRWRRVIMYWAVRLFGRGNYKRTKKGHHEYE